MNALFDLLMLLSLLGDLLEHFDIEYIAIKRAKK